MSMQLGSSLSVLYPTGISSAVTLVICGKIDSHGEGAETHVVSPVVWIEKGATVGVGTGSVLQFPFPSQALV